MSAPIFLEQTDKNFSLMDSDNRTYSLMGWISKMEAYAEYYHENKVKNVDVGSVVKAKRTCSGCGDELFRNITCTNQLCDKNE